MMNEQELREIVNPVFNTAKSCLQLDAAGGDQDSKLLLEALGFPPFGSQLARKQVPKEMVEQARKLFPAYIVLVESRFHVMNNLVKSRKDRQIADLPCGYTSRGIHMSREGRVYYGLDLPAVIEEVTPAVEKIIGKNEKIQYHAVDATNYASLRAAFRADTRNLIITTEGLLMYFTQSELEEVFSNIRRLLLEFGGSWVTTDRAYFLHDLDLVKASLNGDPTLVGMYRAVTGNAAATTADVTFNNNVFFDEDEKKVRDFIRKMGFELREVCMADYLPEHLGALGGNPELEAKAKETFRSMMLWEMVPAGKAEQASPDPNLPFKVESGKKDGVFSVSIQGRMDTITAPELLRRFQEAGEDIREILVDVSRMSYVSSAGLRVLLIMYKSLEDREKFSMTGISREVREILETTGFDEFLLKE